MTANTCLVVQIITMLSLEQILNVNIGQKRCFFVHWKNKNKMNKWRAHVRNHITYFCDRLKELVWHDFTQTCGHVIFFLLTYFSKQIVNWSDLSWWQARKSQLQRASMYFWPHLFVSQSKKSLLYLLCRFESQKYLFFGKKMFKFYSFFPK